MKQSIIPWIIVGLMGVYVYGLTYHAHNRQPPDPSYEFYDTTAITIHIKGAQERHDVYGRYNNILEGQRQLIKAREKGAGRYQLVYKINSPRPAVVYVDDEALEVFLVPGDTSLKLSLYMPPASYQIDSLHFEGKTAEICRYYREKSEQFDQIHLRAQRHIIAETDFSAYAQTLDSLARRELSFLQQQANEKSFPDWFVDFEQNEILYQKAYLKLARAHKRPVDPAWLDAVELDNEAAVFCYYYYLYLNTYLSRQVDPVTQSISDQLVLDRLAAADSLLTEGPHDVYFTREIFSFLAQENYQMAADLLSQYESGFFSKKYIRFLRAQLQKRRSPS